MDMEETCWRLKLVIMEQANKGDRTMVLAERSLSITCFWNTKFYRCVFLDVDVFIRRYFISYFQPTGDYVGFEVKLQSYFYPTPPTLLRAISNKWEL